MKALTPERQRILSVLNDGRPRRPCDIAKILNKNANSLTQIMQRMIATGHLKQVAYGYYAISKEEERRQRMIPTPRPWRVDRTYPSWPMIVGADGSHVNVDFQNAADAELIVAAVNACGLPDEQFEVHSTPPDNFEYVEFWGAPVRMP